MIRTSIKKHKRIQQGSRYAAHDRGFTLIEILLSVSILAIAISICIQSSDLFSDSLSKIIASNERQATLKRATLFLDDLYRIASTSKMINSELVSSSQGSLAQYDKITFIPKHPNQSEIECQIIESRSLNCTFHSGGITKDLEIFSLAELGFIAGYFVQDADYGEDRANAYIPNIRIPILKLIDRNQKGVYLHFGIFPGIYRDMI